MRIEDLIRRLREQMNARIAQYNELTETLNGVRSAENVDSVREAELVEQRSNVHSEIEALRVRVAGLEDEARADAAIDRLQSQITPDTHTRVESVNEPNPVYRRDDVEHSYG